MSAWATVDLPDGSLVVERYEYTSGRGAPRVQWLAESVNARGELLLHRACKTRRQALAVLESLRGRVPAQEDSE